MFDTEFVIKHQEEDLNASFEILQNSLSKMFSKEDDYKFDLSFDEIDELRGKRRLTINIKRDAHADEDMLTELNEEIAEREEATTPEREESVAQSLQSEVIAG